MIFPYRQITAKIRRPIIPVILSSGETFTFSGALIDSGADYCIFSLEIAQILGISLSSKSVDFLGLGREVVKGNWGRVNIKIGGSSYMLRAIFADIPDFGYAVLGQQGFFDHFDVKLSYRKQTIEIESTEKIDRN